MGPSNPAIRQSIAVARNRLERGTTTITGSIKGISSQLTVQVSGAYYQSQPSRAWTGTRHYSIYVPPFWQRHQSTRCDRFTSRRRRNSNDSSVDQPNSQTLLTIKKYTWSIWKGPVCIPDLYGGSCCGSAQTTTSMTCCTSKLIEYDRSKLHRHAAKISQPAFNAASCRIVLPAQWQTDLQGSPRYQGVRSI